MNAYGHNRLLLVSCAVSVVVIQPSTQCQQTFPCCTVCLVWLALGAREIPYGGRGRGQTFLGQNPNNAASWRSCTFLNNKLCFKWLSSQSS